MGHALPLATFNKTGILLPNQQAGRRRGVRFGDQLWARRATYSMFTIVSLNDDERVMEFLDVESEKVVRREILPAF
jgi:hypothetical protein